MSGSLDPDGGAINTPVYNSNRIYFSDNYQQNEPINNFRYVRLVNSYEVNAEIQHLEDSAPGSRYLGRQFNDGDPVSIIVQSVYIPEGLSGNSCTPRSRGLWRPPTNASTRDIAVLLDVSTASATEPSFIVVWYQRGVVEGQALNFDGLHIFSEDQWSSNSPPYFRIRIVDVREERNAALLETLDAIGNSGHLITSLLNAPASGPFLQTARQAARMLINSNQSQAIIDYTFNAYPAGNYFNTGGIATPPFITGAMVLMGRPCNSDDNSDFWTRTFRWDQRSGIIQSEGPQAFADQRDVPFLVATLSRSSLAVPSIVQTRSRNLVQLLQSPVQHNQAISGLAQELTQLSSGLEAYDEVRRTRENISIASVMALVDRLAEKAPSGDIGRYYINALYQITGHRLPTFRDYKDWIDNCRTQFNVNISSRTIYPQRSEASYERHIGDQPVPHQCSNPNAPVPTSNAGTITNADNLAGAET